MLPLIINIKKLRSYLHNKELTSPNFRVLSVGKEFRSGLISINFKEGKYQAQHHSFFFYKKENFLYLKDIKLHTPGRSLAENFSNQYICLS